MLAFLMGLLGVVPSLTTALNGITSAIANERIATINATTDQERIASQERINALNAQRDALLAEVNKSSVPIWIAAGFALGPMFYLNKIFVYDKVLGWGTTDPLDPNLWNVVMVVLGFYFVHQTVKLFK